MPPQAATQNMRRAATWRSNSGDDAPSPDNERRSGQDLEEQQTGCDRSGAGNRSEVDRQH